MIADQPDARRLSIAHQAAGIVLRDAGEPDAARRHLGLALRAARRLQDRARVGDVLATLGVALVTEGRTRAGLARLEQALAHTSGLDQARVRLRRANALLVLDRPAQALVDLKAALATTRRHDDRIWQARCLAHRAWAHWAIGSAAAAETDAAQAEQLLRQAGQLHEAAWVVNNRAYYVFLAGDLPRALTLLEIAERQFAQSGHVPPHPAETRCRILLTAGLAPEALEASETLAARDGVPPPVQAEALLVAASAALTMGQPQRSAALADRSASISASQLRQSWLTRARFAQAQALLAGGQRDVAELRRAVRLAAQLTRQDAPEAPLAHLLSGRLALELGGHEPTAQRELAAAAAARRRGSPLTRSTGWLASALGRAAADDRRGVLDACRRGLDALDDYRVSFGDVELRALATDQGREIAELSLATAVGVSTRRLLWWSERWRATALAATPVHPPEDPELAAALAGARQATARLAAAAPGSAAGARAERDRGHHESAVRRRTRQLSGTRRMGVGVDVGELVAAVGADALVSFVPVGGRLYAVLVHDGHVTRHQVGSARSAVTESEFARFALRRSAFGRHRDLGQVASRLQQALLAGLAARLPGRVVVIPPAALHAAPWGLLPAFQPTRLSVAPSARLWLRSRAQPAPSTGKVTFVTGPGLTSQASEAAAVSTSYAGATVLSGESATVARTVAQLEGARLAHLAAHGSFRADAPMFSSLQLADGPLYIHDLDRMRRPPHTLILSACDAGDTAAVGVDEGLGLVTSLLGLGASAVLASVVPVNDAATIAVMGLVHDRLSEGEDLATALRHARVASAGDPAVYASAVSFTAWAP